MRNYVRGFAGITGLIFMLMMSLVSVCSADIIATNGKYYVYEYDSGDRAVFYQSGSEQDPSTDEVLHNKNSYGMLKDKDGKVLMFEVEITHGGSTYKMPSPVYETGKFANQKTDGEGYWLDQISNFVMDASTNQRLTDPNDPLVFYYCNEQPSSKRDANGNRIIYDIQGNEVATIPASDLQPYVPTDPTDLHFHDAYMKPVWNDPIDPTADGQHKSGVIKLNGGTDTAGWNGSSLHYYFVDTSEQSAFTKNHLVAASTIASTQAAATIAAQALNIPFPNGTAAAVAAALAVGSTANALNLITQAAGVDTYTAHYVGAISYNGDFIVTGGGTLAGTYQNLNTMSLDANDYTISKQVFTTDLLEAQGNLTVTADGNIFAVNTINVGKNLTNAGKIEGVDSFTVTGDLTNTGTISNVNHLTAASVTNSNFLTVNQMNLTGALTNSGTTKVYGSMTSASIQNTGSLITTGSVETGEFTSNGSGDSCVVFIGSNLVAGAVENKSGMTVHGQMTATNLSNTGTMNLSDVTLTSNLVNSGVIYSSGYFRSTEGAISNTGSLITIKGIEAAGDLTSTGSGDSCLIYTQGMVKAANIQVSGGKFYAATGVETGNLNIDGSDVVFVVNSNVMATDITNDGSVFIKGVTEANSITTTNSWVSHDSIITSGNITASGTFAVTGDITAGGEFQNSGTASVTGTLQALSANNSGTFESLGNVKLTNDLENTGTFTALGTLTAVNVNVSGSDTALNIKGNVALTGDLKNEGTANILSNLTAQNVTNSENAKMTVGGNAELTGDLQADGETGIAGNLKAKDAKISETGKLAVGGNAELSGNLEANGETIIDGSVKAKDAKVAETGKLAVGGNAELSGDLEANGETAIVGNVKANTAKVAETGKLAVGGNAELTGDLEANGETAIVGNVKANTAKVAETGKLAVGGNAELTGDLEANGETVIDGSVKANTAKVAETGKLAVGGNAELTGDLEANGETAIVGNVKANTAKVAETGTLAVGGNAELTGDLEANGETAIVGNVKANTAKVAETGKLAVGGNAELTGNLEANGETAIGGNVKANSAKISETGKLAVGGNAELSSTLETSGEAIVSGNVKAGRTTVSENGALAVGGNSEMNGLENAGAVTLVGDANITADLQNTGTFNFGSQVTVKDDLTNSGTMEALTVSSGIKAKSNLINSGSILDARFIEVDQDVTNAQGALIYGKGFASSFLAFGAVENQGEIKNFESVSVGSLTNIGQLETTTFLSEGPVTNSGTMLGTGEGSLFKFMSSLENAGEIGGVEKFIVKEDLTNSGTLESTGKDSKLSIGGNLSNESTISNFESADVTGKATNSADGTIIASGAGSNYTFGELENAGTVGGVEKLAVDENLTNSGTLSSTGKNSSLSVRNELRNQGNGQISNFENADVIGKVTNEADATITASGTGSKYAFGELENAGTIQNLEDLDVAGTANVSGSILGTGTTTASLKTGELTGDGGAFSGTIAGFGTVTNDADLINAGLIQGTGANSVLNQNGKLTNQSELSNFQTVNVAGELQNENLISGTETNSSLKADGIQNSADGTIQAFDSITSNGDVQNEGQILGNPAGTHFQVTGDMTNAESGLIADVTKTTVSGSFTNAGTLTGFKDIIVDEDFTNESTGTINVQVYDGKTSKISVNGAATLNGGTINFYGERLEVGKDYAFLLVEGSEAGALNHDPTWSEPQEQTHGLTVNSPLTITATNSPYGENSSITSSTISSAIPKLFHAEGFYNQNEYWVSLRRDYTYGDLEGASEDQQAIGKYVDRIAYSINTTNDSYDEGDLFKVLEALDDSREAGGDSLGNLDQLSGAIYASQGLLAMQNTWFAHQNLANFIRPMDCVYDDPELNAHNIWGGFVANSGNFKSDGNGQTQTYDSAGVIVGYDFFRSFNFRGGAYFQYQNVRSSEREVSSGAKTDYYDLGLYGLYLNEYGYIMASGNLSYGSFQSSRYVAFGGEHAQIAREHEGGRNGFQQSIRFETAATLSFAEDRLLLHPFVGMTFIHMNLGSMIESGSDEYVTALRSSGGDLNSLRPELGARLSCCHRTDNWVFGLNLRGSWVHEFCDTQTTIENRFSNPNYAASALPGQTAYNNPSDNAFNDESASFFVTSSNLGRDYAWLGFGLTADTSSNWTFFGGYDVLTNSRATIHTGNLGLSYSW